MTHTVWIGLLSCWVIQTVVVLMLCWTLSKDLISLSLLFITRVCSFWHKLYIELGLKVLAESGWFCEIGKKDIYTNSKIGMFPMRKNITITAVDIDRLLETHPRVVNKLALLLADLVAQRELNTIQITEYQWKKYQYIYIFDISGILWETTLYHFGWCNKASTLESLFWVWVMTFQFLSLITGLSFHHKALI